MIERPEKEPAERPAVIVAPASEAAPWWAAQVSRIGPLWALVLALAAALLYLGNGVISDLRTERAALIASIDRQTTALGALGAEVRATKEDLRVYAERRR